MTNHRQKFFDVLDGKMSRSMPFVPDITYWYIAARTPAGLPHQYWPGSYIPDDASIHCDSATMPEIFSSYTLLDFYRKFDWGFHAHIYDWFRKEYSNGAQYKVEEYPQVKIHRICTPIGELGREERLAADGTWCPVKHYVQSMDDLAVLRYAIESERYTANDTVIQSTLEGIGDLGQADLVIGRSPFGKLFHEYMGFEAAIYALVDSPDKIREFLELQEEKDLEVIRLAANRKARLVIISDHADETLISPRLYQQYCIPFYQKACNILHKAGKYVSTHLDGNFKGHFPLLEQTGFNLLDGCTPAPMFNYEIEELAKALPKGMYAFCGVPASLFCQNVDNKIIFEYADRIMESLEGRAILNIGDILPPNGNIQQVIALGEYVRKKTQ
jgi:hypothetical protein